MSVASVSSALRNNLTELGLQENEEGRLFATLRFVEQGLPEKLRPMLPLVGLHESYLNADYLEAMAQHVEPEWTRALVDQLMAALGAAGLLRELGNGMYEMHPLLTSYLRSQGPAPQPSQRAFVDIMARIADDLARKELHEQRVPFLLHGANFHQARTLSENPAFETWYFAALTQSLAAYAQNSRDFVESRRLFEELGRHAVARGDSKTEAISYHQLGMIAEEQRDFETAREWYLKSLAIFEQQGNLHGAASSYSQLGVFAARQGDWEQSSGWVVRGIKAFREANDNRSAEQGVQNFFMIFGQASAEDKQKMRMKWQETGLGPFPQEADPS